MPTPAQMKKIWLLSDTVLYPEAVAFMQRHVRGAEPLPTSQVMGLFNATAWEQYPELYKFVTHQRDRNWPYAKMHIKKFYTALEETLTRMDRMRLRNEFHLLEDVPGRDVNATRQEMNELMALLAREFIQHVLAENGVLLQAYEEQRQRERGGSQQSGLQRNQGQQRPHPSEGNRRPGQPEHNNRRQQWQ
jgi:hypothetical protein